jgi:hypothetical protein
MLIIQIALGIVLAVLLLLFLPQILTLTIWVIVASIVAVALSIGLYFLTEKPVVFLLLVVAPISAYYLNKNLTENLIKQYIKALDFILIIIFLSGITFLLLYSPDPSVLLLLLVIAMVTLLTLKAIGKFISRVDDKKINRTARNHRKLLGYDD